MVTAERADAMSACTSRYCRLGQAFGHAFGWMLGLLALSLLGSLPAAAQSDRSPDAGTAYFHRAAQHYLADDTEAALHAVEEGLRVAPDHPTLQALQAEIERQPPQPDPSETGQSGAGAGAEDGERADANQGGPQSPDGRPNDTSDGGTNGGTDGGQPPGESPSPNSDEGDSSRSDHAPSDGDTGQAGTPSTASQPPDSNGDPSSRATAPEAAREPTEVRNPPSASSPRSASPQPVTPLTQAEAEALLQLVEAQGQPLMRAMRSFGSPSETNRDW